MRNCDWFRLNFYGDMDISYGCALLISVVVYMLSLTKLCCSVDISDYYVVVVNGNVLSCMGSLFYILCYVSWFPAVLSCFKSRISHTELL
jgi:hypothetical protein